MFLSSSPAQDDVVGGVGGGVPALMDHSQSRAEGTRAEQTQMDLQKSEEEPSAVVSKLRGR